MVFQNNYLYDKISCLNFFPHVQDKPAFLLKIQTLLKPGGVLFIMHDISRAAVNAIHGSSERVKEDQLAEGSAVVEMLSSANFRVETMFDNEQCYFIKAVVKKIFCSEI